VITVNVSVVHNGVMNPPVDNVMSHVEGSGSPIWIGCEIYFTFICVEQMSSMN
jgi:hypothetical protein